MQSSMQAIVPCITLLRLGLCGLASLGVQRSAAQSSQGAWAQAPRADKQSSSEVIERSGAH